MALRVILVWLFIALGTSSGWSQAGPGDGGVAGNNGGVAGQGPGNSGPSPPPIPVFPLNLTTSPLVAGSLSSIAVIPTSLSLQGCCSWTRNVVISGFTGSAPPRFWTQIDSAFLAGTAWNQGSAAAELESFTFPRSNVGATCGNFSCAPVSAFNDGGPHMLTTTYCADVTNAAGTVRSFVDGIEYNPFTNSVGYAPSLEPIKFGSTTIPFNLFLLQSFNQRCWQPSEIAAFYVDVLANNLPPSTDPLNTGVTVYMPMECAAGACSSKITDISGNNNNAFFDTTPPTAVVTEPTAGLVVTGPFSLTATSTDIGGSGVNYCQFAIDNTNVGPQITSLTSTFVYAWNSATVIDASHQVNVTCVDRVGNSTTSATVTFSTSNSISSSNWYFSASSGLDTNNCHFQSGTPPNGPCKTITHLNSLHYGEGDFIHMNATDGSFTDACINLTPSNVTSTFSIPITIEAYNAGQWVLVSPCTGVVGAVGINQVNAVVQDCSIHPATAGPTAINNAGGIWAHNDNGTSPISLVVQRCSIGDYNYLFDPGGAISGDILMYGFPGPQALAINATLSDNTLCGATNQSSDAAGVSGFGNGTNITAAVTGNITCNQGGSATNNEVNGILASGWSSGSIQFHLSHDIGYNNYTCGGPYGVITDSAFNVTAQFFESYNVQSGDIIAYLTKGACDHGGADMDQDTQNTVFQDYYVHDSFGPGTLIFQQAITFGWKNNTVRYAIDENNGKIIQHGGNELACLDFVISENTNAVGYYYNNTCFNNLTAYAGLNPGFNQIVSTTGSISGTALTVASGTSVAPGEVVQGTGVSPNTVVLLGSGTSWVVNNSQTVTSTPLAFFASFFVTVANGGTGGTPGLVTLTSTVSGCSTTPFTLQGVINSSGVLTGQLTTINPGQCITPNITEPVSGGGLSGATVNTNFNSGGTSGVYLANGANMTAIIANNIWNVSAYAKNAFGGAAAFFPIKDIFSSRTQAIQFENNTMTTTSGGSPPLAIQFNNVTYSSVAAFQAANSGSTGNLTQAPGFSGSPPFGTLTWTPSSTVSWPPSGNPSSYVLNNTSNPLIGAGIVPQSGWVGGVPTRDYYGNAQPNAGSGSGWNLGADGGNP